MFRECLCLWFVEHWRNKCPLELASTDHPPPHFFQIQHSVVCGKVLSEAIQRRFDGLRPICKLSRKNMSEGHSVSSNTGGKQTGASFEFGVSSAKRLRRNHSCPTVNIYKLISKLARRLLTSRFYQSSTSFGGLFGDLLLREFLEVSFPRVLPCWGRRCSQGPRVQRPLSWRRASGPDEWRFGHGSE